MENQKYLNANDSNPNKIGWMKGFPPEESKCISANDGSFFEFPALRYSVNHIRELYPTRAVEAGAKKFKFKSKIDRQIESITFVPWNEKQPVTWNDFLERNYTDGIIILHKGKIVYEKYPAGLKQNGVHSAMSVSKSFTGILASILIDEGIINPEKLVTDYLPELQDSGFAGATVRNVLDMTTAIEYSEDYTNPNAEVWKFSASGNVYRPADYSGPKNYYEYIKTVKKIPNQEHGQLFGYKTVNTELTAWIISRVTGKSITQLLSEKIWKPMEANYYGFYQVGTADIAFAGGGFSLNLRDMALFGELLRNGGKQKGKQILTKKAVLEVSQGGSQDAFKNSGEYPLLKGWSYHNMWWITNNSHKAFMARGVHGQAIYIDPKAQMVIARFASNPLASNKYIDPISIPAYEAIADYLLQK